MIMMVKKGDIVYHKGLIKRKGIKNAAEFKIIKINKDNASVKLLKPAKEPFDIVGKKWDKIPVSNLIKIKHYHNK